MNRLKNAIQNNTFSVDELSEISKKMPDLGIAKEYSKEQLALIDRGFGKIKGLTWRHHQVPGKMQLVLKDIHGVVNHLGGNKLWGGGIR